MPDSIPARLFGALIKDRHRRWWLEQQPHPYKQLGGKLRGREFAAGLGVKVPEMYAVADELKQIPNFDQLPERFVIKPTRGWSASNVFLMESGRNQLDGQRWSREQIIAQMSSDPTVSQPGVRILIEEYLRNWDGKPGIPYDFKFYMFGSNIAFIHAIERNSGVRTSANRHWFMTEDWNPVGKSVVATQRPERDRLVQPDCYDELLEAACRIGRKLNMFMRVDMYATTRGAVFGEFTPQPHGGDGFTPWADRWLGSLWKGEEGVAD